MDKKYLNVSFGIKYLNLPSMAFKLEPDINHRNLNYNKAKSILKFNVSSFDSRKTLVTSITSGQILKTEDLGYNNTWDLNKCIFNISLQFGFTLFLC